MTEYLKRRTEFMDMIFREISIPPEEGNYYIFASSSNAGCETESFTASAGGNVEAQHLIYSNNVQIWTYNRTGAQSWGVKANADGTVSFFNRNLGRVIDIQAGRAASRTNIWQYTYNGTAAQRFTLSLQFNCKIQK